MSASIVEVAWYALAVPLKSPIADAHAALTHWTVPVVEITTDDGLTGTGIGGIHAGAELLTTVIENHYGPRLLGQDAGLIRLLWNDLYRSPLQWVGRSGVTHLALGMIDIALWDLAAQRAGLPLWRLLGGHHTRLQTYNTDGGWIHQSIPELIVSLKSIVADGWSAVKVKVGSPNWRDDVARLQAVRQAIGDEIELSCDANKVWDLTTALKILPALVDLGIAWIEEPLHPDDVVSHAKLQQASPIPVACGESLYSGFAFRDFINADALRIAQPDVTRLAGITEYLDVAALASLSGVTVVPHAGDMMVVHQHLAAASRTPAARIEYLPWTLEAYQSPVRRDGSHVVLPEEPGASTRIAESAKRWKIPGVEGRIRAN